MEALKRFKMLVSKEVATSFEQVVGDAQPELLLLTLLAGLMRLVRQLSIVQLLERVHVAEAKSYIISMTLLGVNALFK